MSNSDYINGPWFSQLRPQDIYDVLYTNDSLPFSNLSIIVFENPLQNTLPRLFQCIAENKVDLLVGITNDTM